MAKKSAGRGNASPVDPAQLPGIKRASELPTPAETVIQLTGSTSAFSLSSTDAAERLGISPSTLIRKTVEENFPHRRMGKGNLSRYRFRPEDLPLIASKLFNEPDAGAPIPPPTIDQSDQQANPVVDRLRKDKPSLFRGFTPADWQELYSTFGNGGALTETGVEQIAERIKWKRGVMTKVVVILESGHADTFAGIVDSMFKQATLKR